MPIGSPARTAAESALPCTDPRQATCVWLVPGLGCRHVGMGADLIGVEPAADRLLRQARDRIGIDLVPVCLEGANRKPLPTRLEAQAIYTLSSAYGDVLLDHGVTPACVVGHSLGTFAALYLAGVYEFAAGLDLVTRAEELMESVIDPDSQALGVVIALPRDKLLHLLSDSTDLWLANENCPGQYVIGGWRAEVERFLEVALAAGAYKAKLLPGARAMHTPLLAGVQTALAEDLCALPLQEPRQPVMDAADGVPLTSAEAIRDYLSLFLIRPVRWEQTVRGLLDQGHRRFVEVGPAAVLTDMMPYIAPSPSPLPLGGEGRVRGVEARRASEELAGLKEHHDAPVA